MWSCPLYQAEKQGFDGMYISCFSFTNIRKKFVQSTNMWLIHTFFCYYFGVTAKIVAAPRYAIPALIILFAMSYAASVLVDKFWKKAIHFLT